ncbi:MAG: nucleotide sugar dehydrogenase [Candidatus Ryanbacteria bacterium]|nr:nucleotide sugar dehydrogenase [Candidatus Ryanbacteria bacterium]
MHVMDAVKALSNKEKIAVVGLGYVGLPLVLLAARKGYDVFGIDVSQQKIDLLKKKQSPIQDESIERALQETSFIPTDDFSVIKDCNIVIICVPTPVYENHMPNLEPVENATRAVAPHLRKGALVILESTVNPGVSESVVLPILESISGMECGKDFSLAHCPERINPGDAKWNVENIPRVVGSFHEAGLKKAVAFYESILTGSVKPMGSLKEAEAVKVVENSFRDINIAFVNELARSFSRLGIDVVNVIDGAATKPFAFMPHYPGCGVGGHCIPVDPYYLIEYAKKNGFDHDFLALARRINNGMPHFAVERLIAGLNEKKLAINGSRIAVLGLSYKANIDDCRESPSFEIVKILKEFGADVVAFDPFVLGRSDVQTLDEALQGSVGVVVATAHGVFKNLAPSDFTKYGIAVVVDGRNCLDKTNFIRANFVYKGVGR